MDSVFRALSMSDYPALFTDSPPVPPSERRQTRVKCDQNAFLVCCRKQTKKFHWQLIKQAVPEIHEEGDEVRFGIFTQVKLCLFDLNLSIKPVKKFFVYKCKLSLSQSLLYLVDLFINKLKTKFDNLFYRMILNTKRIHNSFEEISPQELEKCLQKFIVDKKKRRQWLFGHCAPKL